LLCNGGFFLWWGAQWDSNRAAVRSTVSNQPSGLEPKITDTAAEASII